MSEPCDAKISEKEDLAQYLKEIDEDLRNLSKEPLSLQKVFLYECLMEEKKSVEEKLDHE